MNWELNIPRLETMRMEVVRQGADLPNAKARKLLEHADALATELDLERASAARLRAESAALRAERDRLREALGALLVAWRDAMRLADGERREEMNRRSEQYEPAMVFKHAIGGCVKDLEAALAEPTTPREPKP